MEGGTKLPWLTFGEVGLHCDSIFFRLYIGLLFCVQLIYFFDYIVGLRLYKYSYAIFNYIVIIHLYIVVFDYIAYVYTM